MDDFESSSLPPVACQRCGRVDSTLRVSEFSQVTSAVVVAITRAEAGIYCARCRRERASELNRHSGTFGWLGPRAALKTLDSVASNTDGGKQDPDVNAQLLKVIAHQLVERGDREEAILHCKRASFFVLMMRRWSYWICSAEWIRHSSKGSPGNGRLRQARFIRVCRLHRRFDRVSSRRCARDRGENPTRLRRHCLSRIRSNPPSVVRSAVASSARRSEAALNHA